MKKSFLKKMVKSSLSLFVVLSMCISLAPAAKAAEEEPWDANYDHSTNIMPFTPAEGYVSMQNPPQFKWGLCEGAGAYELVVAKDRELKDIVYSDDTIKLNYFVPNAVFETGIPLYWAVRYKVGSTWSGWCTVRKFRIDPDAIVNPLPPIDEVMQKVPKSHPRIWLQPDQLETFRSYKDTNETSKKVYDSVINQADKYLADGTIITEEEAEGQWAATLAADPNASLQTARSIGLQNMTRAQSVGYAYLLTGDEKYGRFAADLILEYCSWDYVNGLTSYKTQDQTHREIAYRGAMVYDWIYPVLSESEREMILEHIRQRTLIMEYLLNSLDKSPYDSHGWTAYGFIGIIAIATYGEIPEAEGWLTKVIQGYSAMLPPWTYQDGGWSQGTGYARYSKNTNHEFMCVLAAAGILNLYDNAFINNEYLWSIYTEPFYGTGSFGDEGYFRSGRTATYNAFDLMHEINFIDDPETNKIRKWLIDKNGGLDTSNMATYWLAPAVDSVEAQAPANYQYAQEYHDIGWVNMTNSLTDPDAILLTFKSSPYGSYNHSHADQNSFFIQAYGQPLAVNSGWYDSYHSTHDSGFTRKSGAHNTVTVATHQGQRDDDMTADGKLTGYLTQIDFDLAKGDATAAYKGALDKFERSIIYIRPDMFVIVDDLKAAAKKKQSKFEWWLNAEHAMEVYEDHSGARITEKDAVLDAKVHYPQKVTAYYNDNYALSDMVEYPVVTRFTQSNVQTRVWFETEKVEKTKMIVTLDVHRKNQEARYVDTEYFENYVKMTFEDGTILYVNLGENTEEVVTKDGISFTGIAVTYNDESIMLVGGTNVKQGGEDLIILEKEGSVVMGQDELSISTYVDNRISINTANNFVDKLESVTDYNGRELSSAIGITYESGKLVNTNAEAQNDEKSEDKGGEEEAAEPAYEITENADYTTFTCDMDNYQLMLNGKIITTESLKTTVTVDVDGKVTEVPMEGNVTRSGETTYLGSIKLEGVKYKVIDKSEDLIAGAYEIGSVGAISDLNMSTSNPNGQYIKFEKIPVNNATVRIEEDYDAIKDTLAVFKEAEDFSGTPATGSAVYTTRTFLSGGKGVQLFDQPGTQMRYELEVKEEGDYNLVIKYVAWLDGGAVRAFNLNGVDYNFTMEQTVDWGTTPENWRAVVLENPIHLTPGTYTLTFDVVSGSWNYDWFGLVKK